MSDLTTFGGLAGRRAVVTGASGGIGQAIALEFAAAGADVLVHTGRRRKAAESVADRICAMGKRSDTVVLDLSEPNHFQTLVDRAWEWADDVSIWVNNAGADVLTGEAVSWSFEQKLELLWQVDVRATIGLSRAVAERMRQMPPVGTDRVILNLGWDQAETGMAGDSGQMFAAIKGAVMAFSRSFAKTVAPEVRVNCLAPGWIRTAWGKQADPDAQQRAARESMLQRWGKPEDVAQMARFLASASADFITGQVVTVNGGWLGNIVV